MAEFLQKFSILFNPVLLSVLVMSILCLIKINILFSILIATLVGGLIAKMPLYGDGSVMEVLINGMGVNSKTALSYVLLGSFACGIQATGLTNKLANFLKGTFKTNKITFLLLLALIACLSQNLIPIHIAFIPILIPPLLGMMNKMKLDRRAAACSLTFGLKAPYIAIPFGFGSLFHEILSKAMIANGMPIDQADVYKYLWFPALGMFVGLLIAILIVYRKDRVYLDKATLTDFPESAVAASAEGFTFKDIKALCACAVAVYVQIKSELLPLAALSGIAVLILSGAIKIKELDVITNSGIRLMGFIAFVMLVAAGYGEVLKATGGVQEIIDISLSALGGSKTMGAIIMLLLGLLITMGIGTSFGTIPIIATIYIPLCQNLGFSTAASVILLGTAAALGDAGSPASDSTLGPTSGLNADGQHDHIWDTCVPTFLFFNIPLLIFGFIGAVYIF